MSTARRYDKDSLERALVHHEVRHIRPGEDRPKWFIDVDEGRDMSDREVYAFLAGFKLARDRWENDLPKWVPPRERVLSRVAAAKAAQTPRCRNHAVAENFCNECGR